MTAETPSTPQPSMMMRTRVTYLATDQVTRPVGVRVVEPPLDTRQALRGNLYAVVELSGESTERDAFAERLLSVIQRTYYTVKGRQMHVLSEALAEAQRSVEAFNTQSADAPLQAGIIIAALLGSRLMVISNGLGMALVTAGRNIDVYPPHTASATPAPEPPGGWEIYRQELTNGGALFIGGRSWLQFISLRELASTVAYLDEDNSADIAAALLAESQQPALPGVLLLMTPAAVVLPQTPPSGLPPALRRSRSSGLPTALNATPPVHNAPDELVDDHGHIARSPTSGGALYGDGKPEEGVEDPSASMTLPPHIDRQDVNREVDLAGMAAGLTQRARTFFGGMLPERSAFKPVDESAQVAESTPSSSVMAHDHAMDPPVPAQPRAAAVAAVEAPSDTAAPMPQPLRTQGSRARLILLLAVLLLVLVPVVVAAVQWQQGANNRADAEALLDLAEARLASAQEAADADNRANARALLAEASDHVDRARTILVGRSPRADALAVEIQRELNNVLQIQPLYGLVEPLVRFPADASPQRVYVVDQDIFILDGGRQLVQHFLLDLSTNTVVDPAGDVVLRQGEQYAGVEVGRLVDFAWQLPIPGIEDKPNLLVLDRNNNVFKYDQRVEGVTRIDFADQSAWQTPSQIHSFAGRLYILDEGANQIFRYNPGNYGLAPELWFAPQTPVNLNGVQAMAIDGDIWLLYNTGMILRYQRGAQVEFALENSIPLTGEPVDMAVGNQSDSFIYLADRTQERIVVFDKEGAYQRQLQAAEGNPLRGLSGLFVDEVTGSMYILTQSALFYHALPE